MARSTNNQMELLAVVELLAAVPAEVPLVVVADSKYVIDALTKWIWGWRKRGWRTAAGKPVANSELIIAAADALEGRDVRFEWVRGHSGHPLNEGADSKARGAAERLRSGFSADTGPGWSA